MIEAILNRQTFTFSRELEFFSEKELTTQIGLSSEYWLSVILKELLDNAWTDAKLQAYRLALPYLLLVILFVLKTMGRDTAEVVTKILDFPHGQRPSYILQSVSRATRKCVKNYPGNSLCFSE